MDKRVILAVAGAGKTYTICHKLDINKRNLIIAYTHQNIRNIENELIDAFGTIPNKTTIMTYHSFIYQLYLCPYEPLILNHFNTNGFVRKGITTFVPPNQRIIKKGRAIPNPKYIKDSLFEHYVISNMYYCALMSKLIFKTKSKQYNLAKHATINLKMFFDNIYIDEFQDFREYDFSLITQIIKYCNNITLVGDYFQHSVNAQNNSGKPFKSRKNQIEYSEYIAKLQKMKLIVDKNTLSKTRRCPSSICEFIQDKLKINILANNDNIGKVIFINNQKKIIDILNDNKIVKLLFSESNKYFFNCINWGYSKGDTYKKTCVILTKNFDEIDDDRFDINSVSTIAKNKLYVALTRTKGDLYIIKKNTFDKIKNSYLKECQ